MKVLVVGTGGVGAAVGAVATRRRFFERMTFADLDRSRAERLVASLGDERLAAAAVDASDQSSLEALIRATGADAVLNATDPRFNPQIFAAAFATGATYLDMAMTLSSPDPERPYERPGVKLGDAQFAEHERWVERGQLALVGIGVEPGLSDVFARYAADHLFDTIDEVAVRDGADLVVEGYDFAPTFSIWTTIEECLNPPLVWERERGFYTTEPFSEPELFEFPEGIGVVECVNVEHEEVVLVPRAIECRRVTFKYGLGAEFIDVLKTLHKLGLDSTDPVRVRAAGGASRGAAVDVAPRDVVAAALPDPATLGDRMRGRTCAGTLVTGVRKDGTPGAAYLYHVADNERCMREYGHQAVVLQTALNPVVALELLAEGVWSGVGVLGPESFDAAPFLELLADYGEPHGIVDGDPRASARS
ncbi:MAG: saccharopine dehydrogenase NADP-binding domain-containing protein [Thermoleophilia bacterium]|nr:saccharopine dehydrogenase NADP-binding domain-containing protein [Thermoleophilia bacterium]